jgi:hypothetical protein
MDFHLAKEAIREICRRRRGYPGGRVAAEAFIEARDGERDRRQAAGFLLEAWVTSRTISPNHTSL